METAPGALALTEGMYLRINDLEEHGLMDIVEAEHLKGILLRHLPADRRSGPCVTCGVEWMCPPVVGIARRLEP